MVTLLPAIISVPVRNPEQFDSEAADPDAEDEKPAHACQIDSSVSPTSNMGQMGPSYKASP